MSLDMRIYIMKIILLSKRWSNILKSLNLLQRKDLINWKENMLIDPFITSTKINQDKERRDKCLINDPNQ